MTLSNPTPAITEYLIDSDVLIQAHRSYYAFDICSGFWDAIINNTHSFKH
jgi:hypothetical protein